MKKLLLYLFFTYLALTAQSVFFKGIKPDVVLILISFYSLKFGQTRGLAYGALSGLIVDATCGFLIGPHILSKSVAGFLTGAVKEHLYQWNVYINTLVIAVLSLLNLLIVYTVFETFSRVSFTNRSFSISVIELIFTVFVSMVMYPMFISTRDGAIE